MLSCNSMHVVVIVLSLGFSAQGLRLAEDPPHGDVASNPVTEDIDGKEGNLDDDQPPPGEYVAGSSAPKDQDEVAPPEALPYEKIYKKMRMTECQNKSFVLAMLEFSKRNSMPLGFMQNYMEAQVRYFNRPSFRPLSPSLPRKPAEKDDPQCAQLNHQCMQKFTAGCKKSKDGKFPKTCCNPIQGSCVCMHNAACKVGVGKCPQLEYNDIKADAVVQYQTQFAYWIIFKTIYVKIMADCDNCQEDEETRWWKPNNQPFGQKCGPCCEEELAKRIGRTCANETLNKSRCVDDDLIKQVWPYHDRVADGNPFTF